MPRQCANSGCSFLTDSGICKQCSVEQNWGDPADYNPDGTRADSGGDFQKAELRDGETRDDDNTHARRNAEQKRIAERELEDEADDPELVTDGGIDPLVCPRGHHAVKINATRFNCDTCYKQGRDQTAWDRSELIDLREETPPLVDDDREIRADGGTVRSPDRPEWTPDATTNECLGCGAHVTPQMVRGYGTNDGRLYACTNCSTPRDLRQGAGKDPNYDPSRDRGQSTASGYHPIFPQRGDE